MYTLYYYYKVLLWFFKQDAKDYIGINVQVLKIEK